MNLTIINGTNRVGNATMNISQALSNICKKLGQEVSLVTLDNFTRLFQDIHITIDNATTKQKKDLLAMIYADVLVFVVPTYHSGIPGALKNFFDLVKCKDCYGRKIITFIAGSDHNQDLGARQAAQVVGGILSYDKSVSLIIPRITVVDFHHMDYERLRSHMLYTQQFAVYALLA